MSIPQGSAGPVKPARPVSSQPQNQTARPPSTEQIPPHLVTGKPPGVSSVAITSGSISPPKGITVKAPVVPPFKLPPNLPAPVPTGLPPVPDVAQWLDAHPQVGGSLKWQFKSQGSGYSVPETDKKAWPQWSDIEKQELVAYFNQEWIRHFQQLDPHPEVYLTYPPLNQSKYIGVDIEKPQVVVDALWARTLFLRWMALHLVTEVAQLVPWSVLDYSDESRQILFDSAALMARAPGSGNSYIIGSCYPEHSEYVMRKDNLGSTLIAPPRHTLAFLTDSQLVGGTRIDTIHRLLGWCTKNLRHFEEAQTYAGMEATWHYRGLPPLDRILNGSNHFNPNLMENEFAHWTAGCHGTFGFLRNVLRAVNIPVQGVRIAGHSLVHFITEGKYMDHGDNPYNGNYKKSGLPPSALLIDSATFVQRFGPNPDNNADHPENVSKTVNDLPP